VLTISGITLLGVYVLVARLSAKANAPPAPAPSAAQPGAPPAPARSTAPPQEESDAIAALVAEANGRLAQSPQLARERARSAITDFPAYVILGSEASGKTSLFLASGLDLELLAGQVHRESAVVPTRLANIWFGAHSVVVEAAGQFFSGDPGSWGHFLEMFRPARGKSGLGKMFAAAGQANIRAVVYCCDVSAFLGMPDTSRQAALAQRAQQQLRKAAEVLGADCPVYVVFTKADGITYFGEYFNRLTDAEDQQILGCTLPVVQRSPSTTAEAYASVETARLTGAMNSLYVSLADKRLVFLDRERDRARKPAVYEFPRELRRIRAALVQFLVDVFRPNPLQPNPALRGFYFTGTRKVAAAGSASDQASRQMTGLHKVGEVTRIFRPEDFRIEPESHVGGGGGGREQLVTRWAFAGDLWRSILRAGQTAAAPVTVNRRQQNLQRLIFAGIAGVSALALLLFLTSWVRNRSLLGDVQAAAAACEPLPPHTAPSLRYLQGIDRLRESLALLVDYDETHPPLSMRFGLYSGGRVIDAARHIYFTRFREYFLNDIVRRLETEMAGLPPSQTDAFPYQTVYTDLKTYRTISHSAAEASCSPDSAFSTGLLAMWRADRGLDAESEKLARANFDFYVDALKRKRIPDELMIQSKDLPVVKHGRDYLNAFKGAEPMYHRIIEQVNQEATTTARLSDLTHNTKYRSVLRVADQVDTAFTRAGWDKVQQLIDSAAEGRSSDSCVLGTGLGSRIAAMLPGSGSDIKRQLREMYIRDYKRRWEEFLAKASALPYTNCGDAAEKLELLKDNYSPMLAVVLLAAENTSLPKSSASLGDVAGKAVEEGKKGLLSRLPFGRANQVVKDRVEKSAPDSGPALTQDIITQTFQPARAVFEKPNREHWVDKRNEAYLNALAELQRAIQTLSRGGKCDESDQNANNQANAQMLKGLDAVNGLSRNFDNAGVYDSVKAFLESPIRGVRPLIMTDPAEVTKRKLNGGQAALCSKLNAMSRKYPFNRNVDDDVGLDQMTEVFAPQTGLLANVRQLLGDNVVKTGTTWTAKPDAALKVSRSFLVFFNQASAISDALFPPQGSKPGMRYKLVVRPNPGVREVKGTLDGESFSMPEKQYSWPAASPRIDLRLVQSAGGDNPLRGYPGNWGIFKMLSGADRRVGPSQFGLVYLQGGKGSLQQSILPDGSPIVVEVVEFPNGVQRAFDADFFRLGCPAKVTED
jgi:type VI secretion system protein ImpL